MPNCIEGFVVPVPAANKDAYLAASRAAIGLFRDYGALRLAERWGDAVPDGKVTDFRRAVQAQTDENVVFSWIVRPSKAVRDAAGRHMRNDERMKDLPMPFDGKRMIYGGFEALFDET